MAPVQELILQTAPRFLVMRNGFGHTVKTVAELKGQCATRNHELPDEKTQMGQARESGATERTVGEHWMRCSDPE